MCAFFKIEIFSEHTIYQISGRAKFYRGQEAYFQYNGTKRADMGTQNAPFSHDKGSFLAILAIFSHLKVFTIKIHTNLKQECQILCIFQYLNVLKRQGAIFWSPQGQGTFLISKIRAGCSPI